MFIPGHRPPPHGGPLVTGVTAKNELSYFPIPPLRSQVCSFFAVTAVTKKEGCDSLLLHPRSTLEPVSACRLVWARDEGDVLRWRGGALGLRIAHARILMGLPTTLVASIAVLTSRCSVSLGLLGPPGEYPEGSSRTRRDTSWKSAWAVVGCPKIEPVLPTPGGGVPPKLQSIIGKSVFEISDWWYLRDSHTSQAPPTLISVSARPHPPFPPSSQSGTSVPLSGRFRAFFGTGVPARVPHHSYSSTPSATG